MPQATPQGGDFERAKAFIKGEEGLSLKAYPCSEGKWTIGYGHNLEAAGIPVSEAAKTVWTKDQAESVFEKDFQHALNGILERWPWAINLNGPRMAVLISMAFQMGVAGLATFRNTLALIQGGQFEIASGHMLMSKWAKQTRRRAERQAEMMRTGKWPDA